MNSLLAHTSEYKGYKILITNMRIDCGDDDGENYNTDPLSVIMEINGMQLKLTFYITEGEMINAFNDAVKEADSLAEKLISSYKDFADIAN